MQKLGLFGGLRRPRQRRVLLLLDRRLGVHLNILRGAAPHFQCPAVTAPVKAPNRSTCPPPLSALGLERMRVVCRFDGI
eukprot:6960078-Prymnesium_polylepis.1